MSTYLITWQDLDAMHPATDVFKAVAFAQSWYERINTDAADDLDHQRIAFTWLLVWSDRQKRDVLALHANGERTGIWIEAAA